MDAHQLYIEAEAAREKDNHTEALGLIEQAIVAYQKEENYEGICQSLICRALTYHHLFLLTADKVFAILAKNDAETSIEIAQEYKITNRLAPSYLMLGKIYIDVKDYQKAVDNYQKALKNYSGTNAEKGDYKYHLGEAMHKNGNKDEGLTMILEGLNDIQKNTSEVDPFLAHVWESGCLIRLVELLKDSDPEKARSYLKKVRDIVEADEKLVIRKRQYEELSKEFKT